MSTADTLKAHATGKPVGGEPPKEGDKAREPTAYEVFRNKVSAESFMNDVAMLVGGTKQAQVFVRVVLTAVQQSPALLDADRRSLLLACMRAARDRLMPDGKESVLNIYRTKTKDPATGKDSWFAAVQYLPMVAGLVKKLYDSGHVTFVDALAVYEKDGFDYERGDAPRLVHKPYLGDDPGPIIAAYAVIKLKNGETKREVMPKRDIERVRLAGSAADGPGWKSWYDQFAIKSVIKRAYKQLPNSAELEQVIAHDNEAMGFSARDTGDPFELGTRAPRLEHQTIDGVSTVVDDREKVAAERNGAADTKAAESKGAEKAQPSKAAKGDGLFTFAEVAEAIAKAKTIDELDAARSIIGGVADEQQRAELVGEADRREAVITAGGK